ncbi:MAG: hypothetical protein OEY59_09400 [Deltaproteobacteria bacterium]|nr:hypothetical protein [Deltaproteobacteria bacterium]
MSKPGGKWFKLKEKDLRLDKKSSQLDEKAHKFLFSEKERGGKLCNKNGQELKVKLGEAKRNRHNMGFIEYWF